MKKTIIFLTFLLGSAIVLSGCSNNKTNKEKMQGTWSADNSAAKRFIDGTGMKIKDDQIKIINPESDVAKSVLLNNFNFKDDEQKNIRFYTEPKDDEYFDKDSPDEEGIIHFEDNDTMVIEEELDEPYKFKRE